jgi:hypothetical protein
MAETTNLPPNIYKLLVEAITDNNIPIGRSCDASRVPTLREPGLARAAGQNERSNVKVLSDPYAAVADPDHSQRKWCWRKDPPLQPPCPCWEKDGPRAQLPPLSAPGMHAAPPVSPTAHVRSIDLHEGCLSNNRRHLAASTLLVK